MRAWGPVVWGVTVCGLFAAAAAFGKEDTPAAVSAPAAVSRSAVAPDPRAPTPSARASAAGVSVGARPLRERLEETVDVIGLLLRTVAFLGVIALLGVVVVKLFVPRAQAASGGDGLIRVVARQRIEPRTTLYLLEVAGRFVLVSVSDREVRALTEGSLDGDAIAQALEDEAKGASRKEQRFQRLLEGLRGAALRRDPGGGEGLA